MMIHYIKQIALLTSMLTLKLNTIINLEIFEKTNGIQCFTILNEDFSDTKLAEELTKDLDNIFIYPLSWQRNQTLFVIAPSKETMQDWINIANKTYPEPGGKIETFDIPETCKGGFHLSK